MALLILMVLLIAVVATGLTLLSRQLKLVRAEAVVVNPATGMSLGDIIQCKIDTVYHDFSFFFHQLTHFVVFYSLLASRRVVIILRYLLVRVERRFSRLIDAIRGKGVIHKKGVVSLFLTKIEESK